MNHPEPDHVLTTGEWAPRQTWLDANPLQNGFGHSWVGQAGANGVFSDVSKRVKYPQEDIG
jgi:hypothetical protein